MNQVRTDYWYNCLYNCIPKKREELCSRPWWQKVTWAIFGNDNDGIFGEGPKANKKWVKKWNGKINFRRFISWQFRNPLHNFTNYVIGIRHKENKTYTQLFLISTHSLSGPKKIKRPKVYPMQNHTGIYLGLVNKNPFLCLRINLLGIKWLESYVGWRPSGGIGLALRLKKPHNL